MIQFCPDAVMFDMDGLLVDSEPVWLHAEEDMLLTLTGKGHDPLKRIAMVGLRINDFSARMKEAYGLTPPVPELRAYLIDRMTTLIPQEVTPKPGALELLAYLKERGIPHAIASSSPHPVIDATVEAQGWHETFITRVSGDDIVHGKPAPDIYLEAARRLGVEPSRCLALEDSPNGARSAVAAGMVTIAVPDPSHARPIMFAGITPHVATDLYEVLALLREQGC